MALQEILKYAKKSDAFNTNNAWGFGGGYGTDYSFDNNVAVRNGTACYRHLKPSRFIKVFYNGIAILDKSSLSKDDIHLVLKMIKGEITSDEVYKIINNETNNS